MVSPRVTAYNKEKSQAKETTVTERQLIEQRLKELLAADIYDTEADAEYATLKARLDQLS